MWVWLVHQVNWGVEAPQRNGKHSVGKGCQGWPARAGRGPKKQFIRKGVGWKGHRKKEREGVDGLGEKKKGGHGWRQTRNVHMGRGGTQRTRKRSYFPRKVRQGVNLLVGKTESKEVSAVYPRCCRVANTQETRLGRLCPNQSWRRCIGDQVRNRQGVISFLC